MLKHAAKSARGFLILMVSLTLLGVVIETIWSIQQDRKLTLDTEIARGILATRLLDEHANQILVDAESSLNAVIKDIQQAQTQRPVDDALIRRLLVRAQPAKSILKTLLYVSPKGVSAVSSISYPAFQIDAEDRGYLNQLLKSPQQSKVVFGKPFRRFYDSELVLPIAKNIITADGQYHGVISTDISISYFSKFYKRIARESNELVALILSDGHVITKTTQADDDIAPDISQQAAFQHIMQGGAEGSFWDTQFLQSENEKPELYIYRRFGDFPVVTVMARPSEDVLAVWHTRSKARVTSAAMTSLFILILATFLYWHILRLQASKHSLVKSEAKFIGVFNQSPVPLALLHTPSERILEANDAFLRQFGYTAENCVDHSALELGLWADAQAHQAYLQALSQARQIDGFEAQFKTHAGAVLTCVVSARMVESSDGDLQIFYPLDVSKQREAEANVKSLEAQLRETQKLEAIGSLAGGIAHDFNNILAAVLGNVAMALQELPSDHPVQAKLRQINRGAQRARSLVSQILMFSRRQPQQLRAESLAEVMEESIGLLRSTLPARITLREHFSRESLSVQADGTQLQQVLLNLCTNAWHACESTTGVVTVGYERLDRSLAAHVLPPLGPGDYAHIWVSDNGVGMSPDVKARVFEPFFTTKPVGQGTGLGLSVVHGIVLAHQGAITVDSTLGEGSTFHIYWPLAVDDSMPAATSEPAATDARDVQGRGERVLYLDDDEVMTVMVENLLERGGYQPICLQDPLQALEQVRQNPQAFDIVITDYNMPHMTGVEVAEQLLHIAPQLPVVINSGFISDELLAASRRLGIKALLQKQNTLEELRPLIQRILKNPGA